MNKKPTRSLLLVTATLLIFALALMSVFVLGDSIETASAASYALHDGYSLTSLTINDISVDPSTWYPDYLTKSNGTQYAIYVSHPDNIVAEFEKNSAPVNFVCNYYDLDDPANQNGPGTTMDEDAGFFEGNIYAKTWQDADDETQLLMVILFKIFRVVLKGDFGGYYMEGEDDYYASNESIYDRVKLNQELPGTSVNYSGMRWAEGMYNAYGETTSWSSGWSAFHSGATVGKVYTFYVPINNGYVSDGFLQFEVKKPRIYVRSSQSFVYDKTSHAPTLNSLQIYKYSAIRNNCLLDVSASNVVNYDSEASAAIYVGMTHPLSCTLKGSYATDYVLGSAYFVINKRPATIVWSGDNGATYDGTQKSVSATLTNVLEGDPVASLGFSSQSQLEATAAGNYTVEVEGSGSTTYFSNNYVIEGSFTYNWSILPAPVTLSWSADPTYNGAEQSVTATITGGVVGSDVVNVASYSGNAATAAGDYTATATLGGADSGNYCIPEASSSHSWSVLKKALTVTADNKNVRYGSEAPAYTYSYSGFVTGEDESVFTGGSVSVSCAYNTAQAANRGVGEYDIVPTGTLTADNYDISYVAGTLTCFWKQLTITPIGSVWSITYGDPAPEFSYSISGFEYDDDASLLDGTAVVTCDYDPSDKAKRAANYDGMFAINGAPYHTVYVRGLTTTSANYYISYENEHLHVQPKVISFTWGDLHPVYDKTEKTVTATPVLVYADDDVYVTSYEGNKATNYNIQGDFTYTATITGIGGEDASNYYLSDSSPNKSTKWKVEQRPIQLDITIGSVQMSYSEGYYPNQDVEFSPDVVYAATTQMPSIQISNIIPGDPVGTCSFVEISGVNNPTNRPISANTPWGVGRYCAKYSFIEDSDSWDRINYDVPHFIYLYYDITPAPLTLTWSGDNGATYDGTQKTVTATITGGVLGSDYVDIVEYTNNQKTEAGTYVATASVYDESSMGYNYYIADGYEWSIVARTLNVTADDKETTYGSAAPEYTYSYSGFAPGEDESVITGGSASCSCAYNIAQAANRGAGDYTITVNGDLVASNYTISYVPGTLTVSKKALTITANDKTITYGDAPANDGVTYSDDFVFGETSAALSGGLGYACAYEQYGNVGVYAITPSGLTSDNYDITFVPGTLTVGQLEVTISWSGMAGFTAVYNGAEQTVVSGATVSNKVNDDDVSLTVTGGKGTNVNNETHLATAALAGAKAGNYKLPAAHTRAFTITPKPVSVSAIADDMTYSGEEKGVEASYTDALGQDVNIAAAQITYTSGVSRVNYSGDVFYAYAEVIDDNYTLVGGGNTIEDGKAKFGPYTIAKRGVKATINSGLNAETLVYTGYAKQVPTGSIKFGPVSGEARNLVITKINGNNVNVTAEGFTVSFKLSTDDATNYELIAEESGANAYTVTDGVGTTVNPWLITPATLTVTAVQQSGTMTYSGAAQTPYVHTQVSSVCGQEITYLYSKTNGSGYVALDQITYKDVADSGTLYYKFTAPNHNDVTGSIQITMAPKELTPSITGFEVQYTYGDAFEVSFSGVADSLVGEDTLVSQGITQTYEYSTLVSNAWSDWAALTIPGMTEIRNVGQHKIRYNFTCTSGNYVSHGAAVDQTIIGVKTLTITPVDGQSKTYGVDDDPIFTYTVSGSQYDDNVVPGDTFFTGKLGRAYGFAAGTYAYERGTLAVKAPYSANYNVEIAEGKVFTINKASLTVTADDKAVTYGDAAPEYTVSYNGFVPGEGVDNLTGELAIACEYAQYGNAGAYDITPSGLSAANYDITFVPGTLSVGKKAATVTADNKAVTFGAAAPEYTVTTTGLVHNDVLGGELAFACSYAQNDAVGTYDITPSGLTSDNYAITFVKGSLTVNKAPITLTVSVEGWIFGDAANDPVVSGNLGGGAETIEYKLTSPDDGDYTTAVPTTVGDYTVRYTVAETANYLGGSATGTFAIVSATLNLTVSLEGWTYGDAENVPVVSGNAGGGAETIEYKLAAATDDTYTTTVPSDAGDYTVRVTVAANGGYDASSTTANFTIAKADYDMSGVTFESASVTYDGAAHGLTVGGTLPTGIDGIQVTVAYSGSATAVLDGAVTVAATFATTSANYNVPEAKTATITVLAKELTVVWDLPQGGFVYDGTEQDVQIASVDTGVANETLALTVTASSTFKNAGSYYVLSAEKTVGNDNYTLAGAVLENVSIQPRPITVNYISTQKTVTYGNTIEWNALGAEMNANDMYLSTDDTVANEEGLLDIVACRFDDEDGVQYDMNSLGDTVPAGIYTMVVTVTDYNFSVTTADGFADIAKLIVNKAIITVVPDADQNCTYGSTSALTYVAYMDEFNEDNGVYTRESVNIAEMLEGLGTGWTLADFVTGALGIGDGSGNSYLITLGTLALADGTGIQEEGELKNKVQSIYANYELALSATPVYVTISKAQLTVRAKDRTVKYGESLPVLANDAVSVEYVGFVSGDTKDVLNGTLAFSCGYSVTSTAGTNYAINLGGLTSDKYDITFVPGTLTVVKRTITVSNTNTSAFNYVYGDHSVYALNIASVLNVSGDGFASGDSFTSVAAVTLAVGADKATASPILQQLSGSNFGFAATYWLYALSKDPTNYNVVGNFDDNAKLVIAKKDLTLKANDATVEYGQEAPAFSADSDDFAYDDATKARNLVFSGTLVFECAYNAGDAVGNTYDITPSGVTAGNYNVSFAPGTLTVVKKTLTVTAKDKAITYGDAPANDGVTYSGFIDGDDESDLTGTVTFSYDYDQYDDAGSYRIIPGGVSSDNYEINFVDGVLTVNRKALTVTALDNTITYGDAPANAGVSCIGFADGDDEDDLNGSLTFSYNYQQYGNVGTYAITPLGWTSVNYEIEFVPGTLTVQRKDLTVTAKDKTIPYGDPAANDGVTYSGFTGADTAANALDGTLVFGYNYNRYDAIGTYSITPSGLTATNYNINYVDGVLTVVRRQVTILNTNTAPLSYVYGDASVYALDPSAYIGIGGDGLAENDTFASIATLTLAVGAERATASPILSALNGTNFGYAATYWMYIIPRANDNYVVSIGFDDNAKLVISPKALTVTADDKTVKYGDEAPEFTVTYEGFVTTVTLGGHDFNYNDGPQKFTGELVLTCDYQTGAEVGTYAITPSGVSNGNYDITFVPGVLTVEKRVVTVGNLNTEPFAYVYGDASVYTLNIANVLSFGGDVLASGDQYASIVTVTLAVGKDKATASPILQPLSGSNFGYAATYWLYAVALNDNYLIEDDFDENAKLVISPKALTVTAEGKTVTYGDEVPEFTVTYDGFVGGNYNDSEAKLTGTLTFECAFNAEDPQSRGVGSYVITPGGVNSGNYAITFVPGTLTVQARVATLAWSEEEFVYDKTEQAPAVTVGNLAYDDVVTATVEGKAVNAGDHTATVTALSSENYLLPTEVDKAFTIAKKTATVTADDKQSDLFKDLATLTATTDGILAGDEVYTLSTTADKTVEGTYPIVVTLTGNDNYVVTKTDGTYTVNSNVVVIIDPDGSTTVTGKEKINPDQAKEGGVNITNLIKKAIDAAAEAPVANLSVEIGNGATITFDKVALEQLAKADDIVITYNERPSKYISKNEKDLKNAELAIEVSLGGVTFDGGTATVTTSFDGKAPLGKRAVVYYVDENGKKTDMNATFKDGKVTFTTGHFSTYAVEYVWKTGAIVANIVASIVALVIIILLILFIIKKIKERKHKPDLYEVAREQTEQEAENEEEYPEEAPAEDDVAEEEVVYEDEVPEEGEEEEEPREISLSESLAGAKDFGAVGIVTKESIIEHLAETFGDKVELNGRENRTPNGKLLLSDNHFAYAPSGKRVCFAYIYQDDDGDIIILLRTTAEHAHAIRQEHKNTGIKSAFPKNKERDWYSVIVDETFTADDVYGILDQAALNIIGNEPAEEEEPEEVSLSESLANAKDFGAVGIVTKASIIEHLAETFGDKVELNARENRTPNGKLLLSDNHFAYSPEGKRVCFTYVYEDDEGDIIILLRTTAKHAKKIHSEHVGTCIRSAFPKNKERDWYSIVVDDTFSAEDVYDLLDQAVINITGDGE